LRRGLSPEVNAAATVIIAVSFVLVIASSLLAGRSSAKS
jgi:ABC-type spermidine/putrescine transport system permease subunit II